MSVVSVTYPCFMTISNLLIDGIKWASPESYGAIGDGLTDDTTAIKNCITNNSNVIFGSRKTYRITDNINTLHSNLHINMNFSVITCNDGVDVNNFFVTDSGSASYGNYYTCKTCFSNSNTITNFILENGTLQNTSSGIVLYGSSNIILRNMNWLRLGTGITLSVYGSQLCENVLVENNYFADIRNIWIGTQCNRLSLNNVRVLYCGLYGIQFQKTNSMHWKNVDCSFDKTYATTFCGNNDTDPLNPLPDSAKRCRYPWYSYGIGGGRYSFNSNAFDRIQHYAYSYGTVTNFVLENVILDSGRYDLAQYATKINDGWTDITWINCRLEALYNPLPNTYSGHQVPSDLFQTMKFIGCSLWAMAASVYNDNQTHDLRFTNCTFGNFANGGYAYNGTPDPGKGIIKNSVYNFDNCVFDQNLWGVTSSSYNIGLGVQFGGQINLNGCKFIGTDGGTFSIEPLKFSMIESAGMKSFLKCYVKINNCLFLGTNTAGLYGLNIDSNGTNNALEIGGFEVTNCKFINCAAVRNCNIMGLKVSNCTFDDGTVSNNPFSGTGITTTLFNCSAKTNQSAGYNCGVVSASQNSATYGGTCVFANGLTTPGVISQTASVDLSKTVWYATFYSSVNANYAKNMSLPLTATLAGSVLPSIVGSKLFLPPNATIGANARYTIDSSVDPGSTFCIRFMYTPAYTGGNYHILGAGMAAGGINNVIMMRHMPDTTIALYVASSAGSWIVNGVTTTAWTVTKNREYEMELDIDLNNATKRISVYIDGTQFYTNTSFTTGTRGSSDTLQLGSYFLGATYNYSNCYMRNVEIFNSIQNTGASYTPGYALPESMYGFTAATGIRTSYTMRIDSPAASSISSYLTTNTSGQMVVNSSDGLFPVLPVLNTKSSLQFSGPWASPVDVDVEFQKVNKIATVCVNWHEYTLSITAPSVSTSAGTNPCAPTNPQTTYIYVKNNSVYAVAAVVVAADGSISISPVGANWDGAVGFGLSFSYAVDL